MPTEITVNSVSETGATLAVSNMPSGGSYQLQISENRFFEGLSTSRNYNATPVNMNGLNQRGLYFARARGITAGGTVESFGAVVPFYTAAGTLRTTAPQSVMVTPALIVPPEPFLSLGGFNGEIAGYPAANLARDDPNLIFSSAPGTAGYFYIQAQIPPVPIDTIALLGTNLSDQSNIYVSGGPTSANAQSGTPAFRVTTSMTSSSARASIGMPQRREYHSLIRFAAPVSHGFWQIAIEGFGGSAAQQDIFQARYLVMGLARTVKNISADKVENPLDLGGVERNRDGSPDRIRGHMMRRVDFELSLMTEMQWETQLADLWQKIGLREPMLVVPNSKSGAFLHDRILFGTIAASRATNVMAPRFNHALSVESLI